MKKVKLRKNKDYIEFKESKNIDRNMIAIILKEGKGSKWRWIRDDIDRFSVDNNTYFIVGEGTYIHKKVRFMVYLEGVSTPFSHKNIDKELVEREIVDRDTQEVKKVKVHKIKGLKFDSGIIDMLLNRHLADEFTKAHLDVPNLMIILLLVVGIIIGIANVGMWFV